MIETVSYKDVRAGDLVWNREGYTGRKGHWTRVKEVHEEGGAVILTVADGYSQYGHPREGIGIKRSGAEVAR